MSRMLILALTVFEMHGAFAADDGPKAPATEPVAVLASGIVKPDGKVAATIFVPRSEQREAIRATVKTVDGKRVVVQEKVVYTVSVPSACSITVGTSRVVDLRGKVLDKTALAEQLTKPRPVLATREALDPAFRPILKDDALVLVAPGGVRVEGVPEASAPVRRLTLASALEQDGDVKLYLVESRPRKDEKTSPDPASKAASKQAESAAPPNVARELVFDGVEIQACNLKGERLTARDLLKRLKSWTPVLVSKDKPDPSDAGTFKEDTVVLRMGGHEPAKDESPLPRPGAEPER